MNSRAGIIVLMAIVVASGCGGSGDNTQQSSSQAIAVEGPVVQPTEIFEGSTVRAELNVENVGNLPSEVRVAADDTDENQGTEVMTDYCPDIFNIENFRASSTTTSSNQETYSLEPGHSLQLNWNLQQNGNVPLNGFRCDMKFEIPFTYRVDAYKQVQIKRSETAQTAEELNAKSSNGPLLLYIETIGSSAPSGSPVFLAGNEQREGDSPEALIQLENQQPEDSAFQGLIKVQDPEIQTSGGLKPIDINSDDCNYEPPLIIYNGQSEIIRCSIEYDDFSTPSITGQITASIDYEYVKTVGKQTVKVNSRGS